MSVNILITELGDLGKDFIQGLMYMMEMLLGGLC